MTNINEIYEGYYNKNSDFKDAFPTLDLFQDYVGDNAEVLSHIQDVYAFDQVNPVQPPVEPVKKKEDSTSTSNVDGSTTSPEQIPQVLGYSDPFAGSPQPPSFAELFKKRPKKVNVAVPEVPLDKTYTSFSDLSKTYDANSQKLAETRSAKMYESMPGDVLGGPGEILARQLQDQTFYFGGKPSFTKRDERPKGPEELLLENDVISQEGTLRKTAEKVLAGREEGGVIEEQGLFVSYAPEYPGENPRKDWNRDVLKQLTTTKDIAAAKALDGSKEVEYNVIADPQKIEDYAFEKYLQATGESTPENLEQRNTILEKPSFQLFKNQVENLVNEGIYMTKFNDKMEAELKKMYPNNKDIQEKGLDGISITIKNSVMPMIVQTDQKIEQQANQIIAENFTPYFQVEKQTNLELNQLMTDFKTKYNYNPQTDQYSVKDELEAQLFEKDRDALAELMRQKQDGLSKLYDQTIQSSLDEVKIYSASQQEELQKKIKAVASSEFDEEVIKGIAQKAQADIAQKTQAEQIQAREQGSFSEQVWKEVVNSSYSTVGGFAEMMDLYTFGPSASSATLKSFAEASKLYETDLETSVLDLKYVNGRKETPSEWAQRTFTTASGLKDFFYNSSLVLAKQAPAMAPAMLATMATKNPWMGATLGYVSDSSMELDEVRKRVLKETGSLTKANEAVAMKMMEQTRLWHTYFLENAIYLPESRINNWAKASYVLGKKSAQSVASEFFLQEMPQNYTTNQIYSQVIQGRNYDKTYLEDMQADGLKTFLDVAVGSGGMTSVGTAFDAVGQINREKAMNETLNALGKKGLSAHIVNITESFGPSAGKAMAQNLFMLGRISFEELQNTSVAVDRLSEYADVARQQMPEDKARQAAFVGKLSEKEDIRVQIEQAKTEEKKAALNESLKEIDNQLKDIADLTKESNLVVLKDENSGNIIYAATPADFRKEMEANGRFKSKVAGAIANGYVKLESVDAQITEFADKLVDSYTKIQNFNKDLGNIAREYAQKREQAKIDREAGVTNTPTDEELANEFQEKVNESAKRNALQEQTTSQVPVQPEARVGEEMAQGKPQAEPQVIAEEKIVIPQEKVNQKSFSLTGENETVNQLLTGNDNNAIAQKVINDALNALPILKSLFPNGDIILHTDKDSFAEVNGSENGDGVFVLDNDKTEIHINLSDTKAIENLEVVNHELTHAILQKVFGNNQKAFEELQNAISGIVGDYANQLNAFVGLRDYGMDQSEEFLAQLGAILSASDTPLKQTIAQKILASISDIVKKYTGKDIFKNYRDQKSAMNYFNYISSSIRSGKFNENDFISAGSGLLIPKNNNLEDYSNGVFETGSTLGIFRRSSNLNPILGQFTERPGTQQIASILPVATLAQKIKDHEGAVLLMMSDNTGFFVNESGKFVAGGLGYMAIEQNVRNGIGFAVVKPETVRTTMTNAKACNNGKPVLVLITVSSPDASLGNMYAAEYTFENAQSLLNSQKDSEQFNKSLGDYILNRAELLYKFAPSGEAKLAKQAKKDGNVAAYNAYIDKFRGLAQTKFISKMSALDLSTVEGAKSMVALLNNPSVSFGFRQDLIKSILPETAETRTNKPPFFKQLMKEGGFNQFDFQKTYGEPFLVEDEKLKNNDWGYVVSGFTLDPTANWQELQSKGFTHPQFGSKIPGYNHFLLDGVYGVNTNFGEAMSFGSVPVDKMATQGIQPGTRQPASQPNSMTAEQRREIVLGTQISKRSMRMAEANKEVVGDFAKQFATRFGTEVEFDYNENAPLWRVDVLTGNIVINDAKANVRSTALAFTGLFLETLKRENVILYTRLLDDLTKQKEFKDALFENVINQLDTKGGYQLFAAESKEERRREFDILLKQSDISKLSTFYGEAFENTLLDLMGNYVADQYDSKTGIHKALKNIWDKIKDLIGKMFNVKVSELYVHADKIPLWYLADRVADPRISFEKSDIRQEQEDRLRNEAFSKLVTSADTLEEINNKIDVIDTSKEALISYSPESGKIKITQSPEKDLNTLAEKIHERTVNVLFGENARLKPKLKEFLKDLMDNKPSFEYSQVSNMSNEEIEQRYNRYFKDKLNEAYFGNELEIDEADAIEKYVKAYQVFENNISFLAAIYNLSRNTPTGFHSTVYGVEMYEKPNPITALVDFYQGLDTDTKNLYFKTTEAAYGVDLNVPTFAFYPEILSDFKIEDRELVEYFEGIATLEKTEKLNPAEVKSILDTIREGANQAANNISKISRYQELGGPRERKTTFKMLKDGKIIEMEIKAVRSSMPGFEGSIDVSFKEKGGSYSDFIDWGTQIFDVFRNIINKTVELFPDVQINELTFNPVNDAKNQRFEIYNIMAKRFFGKFYAYQNQKSTVIALPSILAQEAMDYPFRFIAPLYAEMNQKDMDPANSTVIRRSSRTAKTAEDFLKINEDYERFKNQGLSEEEILANLYIKYGHESMRTSAYRNQFANFYDKYVSDQAIKAWSDYNGSWNVRQQGITDFIDQYMLEMSLSDIVKALREGVPFYTAEDGILQLNQPNLPMGNQAIPADRMGASPVSFSDTEIYQAMFNMGISQTALNIIFGQEFRQTIDNILISPDFNNTVKNNLTDDARSYKLRLSMDEISNMGDMLNFMDSRAVLEYINKHLGIDNPTLPALKKLVDKVRNARDMNQLGEAINDSIDVATVDDVQAVSQLATFAGRVLRIMREIEKDPSKVITDNLKAQGIRFSPAFEQQIKNTAERLTNAQKNFEKARNTFFKDFTDENGKKLIQAQKDLDDAQFAWAQIASDPRVNFRFATDVLTKLDGMALLGSGTVVMSAVSNAEVLAKQFSILGGLTRYAVDNAIQSKKSKFKLQTTLNPLSRENWQNLKRAFAYTHKRSWSQIKRNIKYGQLPDVESARFYEMAAQVNTFRDAMNVVNLVKASFEKYAGEPLTTENMADIMQAMMIEDRESGKLVFADGKAYNIASAILRGFFPANAASELTSRLMPLGMDRYAANTIAMKSMLDYIILRKKMEDSQLPAGMIKELEKRGVSMDPEMMMRNLALMLETTFRGQDNPFTAEGLRRTFYADNFITGGASFKGQRLAPNGKKLDLIGGMRRNIRKGMVSTYVDALNAKSDGKTAAYAGNMALNGILQSLNLAQWAVFPFVKVPSNIMIQILARTNPVGAFVSSLYQTVGYSKMLKDFNKKYQTHLSDATNNEEMGSEIVLSASDNDQILRRKKGMTTAQKMEFEKDLADLFQQKKRMVEATADIVLSVQYLAAMSFIAGSGALLGSKSDEDKKKLYRELNIDKNDFNLSYFAEYVMWRAKNLNGTPEEFYKIRGGWKPNVKKQGVDKTKADKYINITNMGTYLGYTLGYLANIFEKQKAVSSEGNTLTEGFKQVFDIGNVLGSITGSVFRQTPSVKMIEDLLNSMSDEEMDGKKMDQVMQNLLSASLAFTSPSLFGKPYSSAMAERPQSTWEIETARETDAWPKPYLDAHMRLSRNGIIFPGTLRSEYYKDEIGLFGEDLSARKTMSEPGTPMAYIESMFNFFSLRDGTMIPVEKYGVEAQRHDAIRNFMIDAAYFATVYANLGGDASIYWKLMNRNRKNSFVLTDTPEKVLTNQDLDKKFKLPNDIQRDEKRILGDYLFNAVQNFKDATGGKSMDDYKQLIQNSKTDAEDRQYIEEFFYELGEQMNKADQEYKKDFLANRAGRILKTMQKRNILSDADLKVIGDVATVSNAADILTNDSYPIWEPRFEKKK